MPAVCARCGAQNPDANLYCMSCGAQLQRGPGSIAAPVTPSAIPGPPPGPPPGFAAPVPVAGGYQSPYYTPAAPGAPLHRAPFTIIVAGVVALILVAAGVGTTLAVLGSHNNPSNTAATGIGSTLPSPSPGVTPSPIASPVSTSATTESADGVSVTVPAGWSVDSKDNQTIILVDPDSTGSLTVDSGSSSPTQTALQNKNQVDDYFKTSYPDTRTCPNTTTSNATLNGASGISWVLCFTVTAGGNSVSGAASLFAGANSSGSVYYLVMLVSRESNLSNFVSLCQPILQSVQWKLA